MLCLQSKDGVTFDCQMSTAKKFPVLAKLVAEKFFDQHTAPGEVSALHLDCISGAALQVLLLAAERPSDYELCSHNALELMVLPKNGRYLTCQPEVLEEILSLDMLGIDAKLEYEQTPEDSDGIDCKIRLRCARSYETSEDGQVGPDSRLSYATEFKLVRIFCGLDKGKVECQLKTAKKLRDLRRFIEAKEEEKDNTDSSWEPVMYLFLDLMGARALAAVTQCAERPDDYEQCSHNRELLRNMPRHGRTVRVGQDVLDEVLENNIFGLEGCFVFKAADERNTYDLRVYLEQEMLKGMFHVCRTDPLEEVAGKFRLKTLRVECRGGKTIRLLRATMEKFKTLARILRIRSTAAELNSTRGDDHPISYKNISSAVLRTLFEIGVRRADFGVLLENAPSLLTTIPENGRRILVRCCLLSELLVYKRFLSECKVRYIPSNVKGFCYVHLVWQDEHGYNSRRNDDHLPSDFPFKTEIHLEPQFYVFRTGDDKFIEVPACALKYFPELECLVIATLASRALEPFKVNFIGFDALNALVQCATLPNASLLLDEPTLHEIFQLRQSKLFDFLGTIKFVQGDIKGTYRFSVVWQELPKRFEKKQRTKSKVFSALCKDGRLVSSHINAARKIPPIRKLLSGGHADHSSRHIIVDCLNAECLETLLDCVERPSDYELTPENAIYCRNLPQFGRLLDVDLNTMLAVSDCVGRDKHLRLVATETNCFGRCNLRIVLKGEPDFEKPLRNDLEKLKQEAQGDALGSRQDFGLRSLFKESSSDLIKTPVSKKTSRSNSLQILTKLKADGSSVPNSDQVPSRVPSLSSKETQTSDRSRRYFQSRRYHCEAFDCLSSADSSRLVSPLSTPKGAEVMASFSASSDCAASGTPDVCSEKPSREPLFHAICNDNASVFALTSTAMKFKHFNELIQEKTKSPDRDPFSPFRLDFISSKALDVLLKLALRNRDFKEFKYSSRLKSKFLSSSAGDSSKLQDGKIIEVDQKIFDELCALFKSRKLELAIEGKICYKRSLHPHKYKLWLCLGKFGEK